MQMSEILYFDQQSSIVWLSLVGRGNVSSVMSIPIPPMFPKGLHNDYHYPCFSTLMESICDQMDFELLLALWKLIVGGFLGIVQIFVSTIVSNDLCKHSMVLICMSLDSAMMIGVLRISLLTP